MSQASEMLKILKRDDIDRPTLGIPAPSSVSHQNYSVGYYADCSILIWSRNDGYLVLDAEQTYYRDSVEHLARCLGTFSQSERSKMLNGESKWIDGVHWNADGSFISL